MGDQYANNKVVGAIGRHASVNDSNFDRCWQTIESKFGMQQFLEELTQLRDKLQQDDSTHAHTEEIEQVDKAIQVAKDGNGPAALQYLSRAGSWALSFGEKVATGLVVAAVKSELGL